MVCYQQSLDIYRQLRDSHGETQTLSSLGNLFRDQGKWEEAIAHYKKSLETFQQLRDSLGKAQTLNNLGIVYYKQGKCDKAIACYEKSLETFRQLGDRHGVGQTLMNSALVYKRLHHIAHAQILWREALTYLHPSSPEFQTVQRWLETPTLPRYVNYLLPLAVGVFILFCLVKGYWLLAILGVSIVFWLFRRSIIAQVVRLRTRSS